MKTLVILGSARTSSDTIIAVEKFCPFSDYEIVDLHELSIQHYSYDREIQ